MCFTNYGSNNSFLNDLFHIHASVTLIFPIILFSFLWTSSSCWVALSSLRLKWSVHITLDTNAKGQFIGNKAGTHAYIHKCRLLASLTMCSFYVTFAHKVAMTYIEILSSKEGKAQLKQLGQERWLSGSEF